MLPFCNFYPIEPGMIGVPPIMVPRLPILPAPIIRPPNNINMCLSTTITNEYDSYMYGRFRHVGRDYPLYRHIPFDWYQPPKQRHNVVHEDAAVLTLDGPVPIGDFYRYYIYGESMNDSDYDDELTSYESEEYNEPSYEQRSTGYRRQSREEPEFDDEEEGNSSILLNRQSMRTGNYPTYNSNRRTTIPPSNYSRNRSSPGDDDFNDAASVNSIYNN